LSIAVIENYSQGEHRNCEKPQANHLLKSPVLHNARTLHETAVCASATMGDETIKYNIATCQAQVARTLLLTTRAKNNPSTLGANEG
jgi:hypothetical protein